MIPSYSLPVALALYLAIKAVYNRFFHPLKNIPGPTLASISPLWLSFQDLHFYQAHSVHAAFKKYGPVVRIAPNKIAFLDHTSIRQVYAGRLQKSVYYKALITNENDHAMTCLDHQSHSVRRRAFAPHYIPSHLAAFQPEIHEYVHQLLSKLYALDKPFESITMIKRLMVDILFFLSYGQRIRSLEQWDFKTNKHDPVTDIVEAIELFPIRGVLRSSVPTLIWPFLSVIPGKAWQAVVNSDARIADYVCAAKDAAIVANPHLLKPETNAVDRDERTSLLHRLLRQATTAKEQDRLSHKDIVSEAMGHTIAGVDTSSTLISYMFYTIALRPDILAKLRAELDPVVTDDVQDPRIPDAKATIPDINVLNKLPYLTAFVKESLRLYGSGPSLLERVVPESLDEEIVIAGHRIPAGTIIASQAWSVHREPSVFPEPEEFKPERWFNETEAMTISTMPFGTGTRICGGMNLAQMVFRIVLAAIVRNFDIVIPPETTPESMELRFAFVTLPAGRRVLLDFVPRKE